MLITDLKLFATFSGEPSPSKSIFKPCFLRYFEVELPKAAIFFLLNSGFKFFIES